MQKRVFLASLAAFSLLVGCAATVPLQNPPESAVTSGLTLGDVKKAVLSAAQFRRWRVVADEPGVMTLAYPSTAKAAQFELTARVEYDEKSFRVVYASSYGLEEGPCRQAASGDPYAQTSGNGKTMCLHRNVNKWLANLRLDIARNLSLALADKVR